MFSSIRPATRVPFSGSLPIAVLLMFAGLQMAAGATYYISPNGNDSAPGTSAQPFRTIARGVGQAVAGDTVIVGDGTYGNEGHISDGTGGWNGYASPVTISSAGTPTAWITLKAQNKGNAILDCGTTTAALGCDKYIYFNPTAAYWAIDGLVITRGAFGAIGSDGGASNIRITNCELSNIGYWNNPTQIGESAIGFNTSSSGWWIEGNVIHDIGRVAPANLDHGIYAEGSNITVINNIFYNMPRGWAIQIANGANGWLIANNTFAFPNQAGGGHIMLWNTNTNISIQNNIFSNPAGGQSYAVAQYTSTVSGCTVNNNVVFGAASVIADGSGCTVGTNIVGQDPMFTNVATLPYNFYPSANAPELNAGVDIAQVTADIAGTPRPQAPTPTDIGAYQTTTAASINPTATGTGTGPAALWDFSEGQGTTVADSSGNGNTGTLYNVTWVRNTAVCSGCVRFNGSSSFISVAESPSLESTQQITVSMWVNTGASHTTDPRLIAKNYSWDVKLNGAAGYPQFSAGGQYFMMNTRIPERSWHHIAFTFLNGTVKGYIDGQPIAASVNTFVAGTTLPLQMYGMHIGTDADNVSFYNGILDDVRIYGGVLTDAQISALYTTTKH
jgi:Concanavalin A-like lectin/glucanases superfamily/Right handed beta helix region/Protein of unknown function (DUF1565)